MIPVSENGIGSEAAGTLAARWALRHLTESLDSVEQQAFQEWLRADSRHETLYFEASRALRTLAIHADAPPILELRRQARAQLDSFRHPAPRPKWLALAASLVLAIGVWASRDYWPWLLESPAAQRAYQTAIGERTRVSLPDGSVMDLDTGSRVEVAYSAGTRLVRLQQGQALFEVAHQPRRPFVVQAAGDTITAVGTRFNVRLDGDRLNVTLLEGKVNVRTAATASGGPPSTPVPVSAGQKLTLRPGSVAELAVIDPLLEASWLKGRLIFKDETLAQAVAEINRYSAKPIVVAPDVGERYHLSGTYSSADPARFARSMTELFPLSLVSGGDGSLRLQPRT